jgi:hypothetical protein
MHTRVANVAVRDSYGLGRELETLPVRKLKDSKGRYAAQKS